MGLAFTNEDLRFRPLIRRRTPTTHAVMFFAMDVSGSMSVRDRQLAKTFFFWVVQGLRRQYKYLEPVFVAHTVDAWEFQEQEFFQVAGTGGTVASSAFEKLLIDNSLTFGGTHFNSPREVYGELRYRFHY